jgi:protein LTV1
LNEQFESLLSAYDDEQLGDLEGDVRAAGRVGPQQLAAMVGHAGAAAAGAHAAPAAAGSPAASSSGEYDEDDFFPSGSDGDGDGDGDIDLTPEQAAALAAAISGGGGKQQQGRGVRGKRPVAPKKAFARDAQFEPKLASLDQHDPRIAAAVRARLAAQEAAAAAAAAGGTGSSSAADGGILDGEVLHAVYVRDEREVWDCESVLSLRSHASHFPARIASEAGRSRRTVAAADGDAGGAGAGAGAGGIIKLNARTGLPAGYSAGGMAAAAAAGAGGSAAQPLRLTQAAVAAASAQQQQQEAVGDVDMPEAAAAGVDGGEGVACSVATSIYERSKGESAKERRARKAAVKEVQREARAVKKALRVMYAAEAGKQQRQAAASGKGTVYAIL